jgi:hypothetical protein
MENYCANFSVKVGYFLFDHWFETRTKFWKCKLLFAFTANEIKQTFPVQCLGVLIFSEIQGIKGKA